MTGVFLRLAGRFIRDRPIVYLVIAVFLFLIALLLGLFIFQFLAYFSLGRMVFSIDSPYY